MKPTDQRSRTHWTVEPPLPPPLPPIPGIVVLSTTEVLEKFYAAIREIAALPDAEDRQILMGWLRAELDARGRSPETWPAAKLVADLRSALVEFDARPADQQRAMQVALDGREIPLPRNTDPRKEPTADEQALREHARRNRILGQ